MLPQTTESASSSQRRSGRFLETRDALERISIIQSTLRKIGELIHPNRITALRLPVGVAALVLSRINAMTATVTYGVATGLDWIDGASARAAKKQTEAGARLDPLVDKLVNDTALALLAMQHLADGFLVAAAGANIVVDWASQRQRGPLVGQICEGVNAVAHPETCVADNDKPVHGIRANALGKMKFLLQSAGIAALLAAGDRETVRTAATIGLTCSAVLGAMGTLKRMAAAAVQRLRKQTK